MHLIPDIARRLIRSPLPNSFTALASWLSIAGLAIGIAALAITLSILQGFEATLSKKIAGFDGHIRVEHFFDSPMPAEIPVLDSLNQQDGIRVVSYIQKPALLRVGGQAEGVLVEALESKDLDILAPVGITASGLHADHWIILGDRLAKMLNLQVGDKIVLFDLETFAQPGRENRAGGFRVAALFHSGLFEYDKTVAYIGLPEAQKIFGLGNDISGKKIILENSAQTVPLARYLEDKLGYPYYILTWKEKHQVLYQWINTQRIPILLIFGLITLVGVINILAAITMIIIEKVREIGILQTMGFPARSIMMVFSLDGLIIGFLGSAGGLLLAGLMVNLQTTYQLVQIPEDIYFMDQVPFQISNPVIAGLMLAGILAATLASLFPAVQASKIPPAQAVRYE